MRYLAGAIILAIVCGCSGAAEAAAPKGMVPLSPDADFHQRTRTAIKDVLADREFADLNSDPSAASRRFYQWLQSLIEGIASSIRKLPDWLVWFIVGWMVLTLLAILAHLIYTFVIMLGGVGRSSGVAGRQEHPAQLLGLLPLEFEAMYAEARRLLNAGEWLAASKHFYVAAILWLDRQGCIAFRLSKTNRDYIEELRSRNRLQAGFRWLTGCFEPIAYGGEPATISTTQDMANQVEDLLHESAGSVAS